MIAPSEVPNVPAQIVLPLTVPNQQPVQSIAVIPQVDRNSALSTGELNLVASHVLLGLVGAVSFIGIVFWALLRLWLFE